MSEELCLVMRSRVSRSATCVPLAAIPYAGADPLPYPVFAKNLIPLATFGSNWDIPIRNVLGDTSLDEVVLTMTDNSQD
ncbi:hypothetical protein AB0H00_23235 [Nocardia sp. NPDC023852]|uniref:hypothetical protein n=1 Tax=Nocardia sp. NPDC023852 TaxID=3154697 RepID=UPI0033F14803